MPYPRKLLNPHEDVAVDLHPHWWYYSGPAAVLLGAIVAGIATLALTESGSSERSVAGWISIALLAVAVVWLISRYVRWASTHFVITSDRIIFRHGVASKSGIEIPLERVNAVHFNQTVFERLVGAGDLVIESGAADGQQRFTDISDPDRVQREIHNQMEVNEQRRYHLPGADAGGTDVASQLEKLEGMLERGTLTRAEFDAQKARLLGR